MNHFTEDALIDYLHGELPPGEDAAVMLHLERCETCRNEYQAQAQLSESLRAYARMTEEEMPNSLRAAIWDRIDAGAHESWRARVFAVLRPAAGVALAAAAAVAIALSVAPRQATAPVIDALYYLDDHAALTSSVPFHEGSALPSSLVTGIVMNDQQWLASSGTDIAVDALTH